MIAVDLDGTLAEYHGWQGEEHIGKPIPLMMARVKNWIAQGRTVAIFTARANDESAIPYVKEWLEKQGLPPLEVTNIKRKEFKEIWDDRAIRVICNTGRIL